MGNRNTTAISSNEIQRNVATREISVVASCDAEICDIDQTDFKRCTCTLKSNSELIFEVGD
jgi:hypothetical protein